ncbi:MAG: peptidoglycan binding protein CsiV [Gammaproteobacteria bacterium]|nr:peptidoglycan binding protein CsiV [Gammaproteobacteria bacterium]
MFRRRYYLSVALILGLISPVFGADQYDIELLIFSRQQVISGGEQWRMETTTPPRRISRLGDGGSGLSIRPAASWQLKGSDARLRDSPSYELLWHARWRQSATVEDRATAVQITAPGSGNSGPLSGWAQFHVGRYPHLGLDLLLQPPTSQADFNYRLNESRRLKSGEIHYYDHPAFGALAIIKPVSTTAP